MRKKPEIINQERAKIKIKEDSKIYLNNDNTIFVINDDFITTKAVKKKSIDLIVTSPPYNVDINYNSYVDQIPYEKYLDFTSAWLKKALELLKDDGRLCVNIPLDKSKGRNEAGFQSVYSDFVNIAKRIGFKYFSTIIWNEGNISRRTAWGSWLSASAPYVIAPVETIIIFYKKVWKKIHKGKSDLNEDEFKDWTNGMWTFSGESKKKIGHPAPFPIELPKRCIKLFSFVGDTVLDPFVGSGTTLVACSYLKRIGIGIEIDMKYCELAKQRILSIQRPLEFPKD